MPLYDLTSSKTGRTYQVEFANEPNDLDIDEAIAAFDAEEPTAPAEQPGYLSQLGESLAGGTGLAIGGGRTSLGVLTGDVPGMAAGLTQMQQAQARLAASQTPEDVAFMEDIQKQAQEMKDAEGFFPTIAEAIDLPLAALRRPGAALRTAVQSLPNVAVTTPVTLAGGLAGAAIGAPGSPIGSIAGAVATGGAANAAIEVGYALNDLLNERTGGASATMTEEQIAAYLEANPDIVDEAQRIGLTRGATIGAVEALGLKGAGRLTAAPARAAEQAARTALAREGVDLASRTAVREAMATPALREAAETAAKAATDQFNLTGRALGAVGIEAGAAAGGELAAQAASGQELDYGEAFLEMLGEGLGAPGSVMAARKVELLPGGVLQQARTQVAEEAVAAAAEALGPEFPDLEELTRSAGPTATAEVAAAVADAGTVAEPVAPEVVSPEAQFEPEAVAPEAQTPPPAVAPASTPAQSPAAQPSQADWETAIRTAPRVRMFPNDPQRRQTTSVIPRLEQRNAQAGMRVVAVNGKTGTVTDQRDTMGLIVQMDDGTTERMNAFTGWHLQSDVLPYLQGQRQGQAPAPAIPAAPATASPAQQVTRTGRPIDPNLTNSVGAMQGLAAGPDGLRLEDGFAYRSVSEEEVQDLATEGVSLVRPELEGKKKKARGQTAQKMWSKFNPNAPNAGYKPGTVVLRTRLENVPTGVKGQAVRAETVEVGRFDPQTKTWNFSPVETPTPTESLPAVEAQAEAIGQQPAIQTPDETEIPEASGLPPVQSQPVVQAPAVEAPEGAALGGREGQEGQVAIPQELVEWDRDNRNTRGDEWFTGGHMVNREFEAAAAEGADRLQAHGMAKEATLSGGLRNLLNLLRNGVDPRRGGGQLYTAQLAKRKGQVGVQGATASGTAYRDGPFVLVQNREASQAGLGIRNVNEIAAVLVNEANVGQLDAIRSAIQSVNPNIIVAPYSEVSAVTRQILNQPAQPVEVAPAVSELPAPQAEVVSPEGGIRTAQAEFLQERGIADFEALTTRQQKALEKQYQQWLTQRGGAFRITLPVQQGGGNLFVADWQQAYPLLPTDNKIDLLRAVVNNRGRKATEQDVAEVARLAQELIAQRPADELLLNESNLLSDIDRAQERLRRSQPLPPTGGVPTASLPADTQPTSGDVGTALRAVATNTATPEQVASLEAQGLARTVQGQPVITDAGLAQMPEAERPRLTEAERVAEIEGGVRMSLSETEQRARNFLSENYRVYEKRPGQTYASPVDKVRTSLGELTSSPVLHETNLSGARQLLSMMMGRSGRTRLYVTNDPDLALGQGGKGIRITLNPERVNGAEPNSLQNRNLAAAGSTSREFLVEKFIRGAVQKVEGSRKNLEKLQKDVPLLSRFVMSEDGTSLTRPTAEAETTSGVRSSINTPTQDIPQPIRPLTGDAQRNETLARRRRGAPQIPTGLRTLDGGPLQNIKPTTAQATQARTLEAQQVPGAETTWIGTAEEYLAENPDAAFVADNPTLEAFYDPSVDRAVILTDRVQVREGDAVRAARNGTSAGLEAVRRLIRHESFVHRGWRALPQNLKTEFLAISEDVVSAEDLDQLAKTYRRFADWRTDPAIRALAVEEWLAQRLERIEKLPAGSDSVLNQLVDWAKRVWQWLAGDDSVEPTRAELVDLMRQMVRALETGEKEGRGEVAASLGEVDTAYMRAVEANDLETAQRLVDQAARAAGGVEFYHGGDLQGTTIDVNRRERGKVSERREGTFYGSSKEFVASTYPGKVNRMFAFIQRPFEISTPASRPALFTGDTAVKKGVQRKSSLSIGEAVDRAKANGYDGVVYGNVIDVGAKFVGAYQGDPVASTIVVFNPSQIKSADPVTYDNNGNVIPLSQRFQRESPDIRFSLTGNEAEIERIIREDRDDAESGVVPTRARPLAPGASPTSATEQLGPRTVRGKKINGQEIIERNRLQETSMERTKSRAIEIVDAIGPMDQWASTLLNPAWQEQRGFNIRSPLGQYVIAEALNRVSNVSKKDRLRYGTLNDLLARQWQTGATESATTLAARSGITSDPRYAALFAVQALLTEQRKNQAAQIDPALGSTEATVAATRNADTEAQQQATEDVDSELRLKDALYELGLAGQNPETQQRIRRVNDNVFRLGVLARLREQMRARAEQASFVSLSASAVEAEYAAMSVEQLDAEVARLEKELQDDLAALETERRKVRTTKPTGTAKTVVDQAKDLIAKLEAAPGVKKTPKPNPVRDLYKAHLKQPMAEGDFVRAMVDAGVPEADAAKLYELAAVKIAAAEATKVAGRTARLLDTDKNSLENLINNLRPKITGGLNWREIFDRPLSNQREWRQQLFDTLRADPALANLSPAEVRDLAAEIDRIWNAKREAAFKALAKRMNLPGAREGVKEKIAESAPALIRYINSGAFNDVNFRNAIADKFGVPQLDEARVDEVIALVQKAQEAETQVERNKYMVQAIRLMQEGMKAELGEVISNYWVTSVLSGFATLFDMALSVLNGARVMTQFSADAIIRQRDFKLAGRAAKNYFQSLGNAILESTYYFVSGDPSMLDNYQFTLNTYLKEGSAAANPFDYFERIIKDPSKPSWAKIVPYYFAGLQRLMTAFDHINSTSTAQGTLEHALAYNRKLFGDARMPSQQDVAAARAKAVQLAGGDRTFAQKRKVTAYTRQILNEEFNKTYPGILDEAKDIGRIAAYQNDPTGIGGLIYHTLLGLTNKAVAAASEFRDEGRARGEAQGIVSKFMREFMYILAVNSRNISGTRFVRFVGNRVNELISFTPGAGFLRLYEKDTSPTRRAMLLQNQTVGILLGTWVVATLLRMMDDEEDDEKRGFRVSGSWQGLTPDRKNQLRANNMTPNSVQIWDGEKWVNFNYTPWPVASLLATVGNLADMKKYHPEKWDAKSQLDRILAAAWAGAFSFKDLSAISGFMDMFGASAYSSDPVDSAVKWLGKFSSNYVGGVVPRMLKDIDLIMDPKARKPTDIMGHFVKEVPFYRRTEAGGEKMYNIFGEQVELNRLPWRRVVTASRPEKEYQILAELNNRGLFLGVANPDNRTVGYGASRRELTDEEAERYSVETGKRYRQFILDQGERLLEMDEARAKEFISRRTEALRNAALRDAIRTQP